jgi:hypothetical protein
VIVGALIVLVVAAIAGLLAARHPAPTDRSARSSAATPEPPPTAVGHVERRVHQPGDCLTWDQDAPAASAAVTTVACAEPHLIEITGRLELSTALDHEPTAAELDELTDRLCLPVNERHLGGPLDPAGRYYPAGIQPSPDSWAAGDREVWCGLGAYDGTGADSRGRHRPFRGPVTAAAQFWRYDRGACLVTGQRASVDCAEPHETEVAGEIEVPDETTVPPAGDAAGWDAVVGAACRVQVAAYLGRPLVEPMTIGVLGIEPSSWSAGLRTAHCLVGERDAAGGWVTRAGSARAVPT